MITCEEYTRPDISGFCKRQDGFYIQHKLMHFRFLYLVGQLGAGGLERQLCYLLQAMDRGRYLPMVAVWNSSEADVYVPVLQALNVPVYALPTSSRVAKLRAFRRLVRQYEPEVVHSYSFYTNFAAYWGVQGTRSIAIGSIRCDFTFEMKNTGPCLGRLSARWPRDQISNSSLAAERVRQRQSPFVPRRVFVVRNGLDLEQFRCTTLPPRGKIDILGVGSLQLRKRWDRVLKAAQELKIRGYDFSLRIVGDGPLHNSLTRQSQVLGIADHVDFIR